MTLEEARALDAADPLAPFRARFALPEGVIYLDGNSLGPLPHDARAALAKTSSHQWGDRLIRSWNEGWLEAPTRIGNRLAPLIGAAPGEVIACDSTSANLYKLIVAALRMLPPERRVVLSEAGNFPTDLHIAEGAVQAVPGARLRSVPRAAIAEALEAETGLLLLTHVHYRTAERFDLAGWTARAQAAGALMLWDLSHSAGAVPIDLNAAGADLAVGCGYKYLNGGPGAPGWLFVAARHQAALGNPLSGWMGHAAPFDFADGYAPAPGIRRWLTGTPPILGLAALEAGVKLMAEADPALIAAKSAAMFNIVAHAADSLGLACATPADPARRGSHIALRHPAADALCQALIARGVIGDFRAPDVLRLALTPLYTRYEELVRACAILAELIAGEGWRAPEFARRRAVP